MKVWTDTYQYDKFDNFSNHIFQGDTCFYDIETTGLMPKRNHIYLIGCGTRKGNEVTITQFFSECNEDEPALLKSFFNFVSNYNMLISFNGIGFDLPFIIERSKLYSIVNSLQDMPQLDIYRECKSIKKLLSLENYKQKTIEAFLGINREDEYNGGQLIDVYHNYVKHPTATDEHLLKIHNYEDVKGMFELIPVLTYCKFLSNDILQSKASSNPLETSINSYYPYGSKTEEKELLINLQTNFSFPSSIRLKGDYWYGILQKNTLSLSIQLLSGQLKYFFEDYKNYDYIPEEDIAIHKSLSSFMDSHRKIKATRENCYTKKEGFFIPISSKSNIIPLIAEKNIKLFKRQYRDSLSYIDYNDAHDDFKVLIYIINSYLNS